MTNHTYEIRDTLIGETDQITHAECVWTIEMAFPELKNLRDFVLSVEGSSVSVAAPTADWSAEIYQLIEQAIAA